MSEDILSSIYEEQNNYNSRILERRDKRYPTLMGKVFGNHQAMMDKLSEIHQELKPFWQWWRGVEIPIEDLEISEEKRQRLIEEHIDVFKFLLSNFILLGVDDAYKFEDAYMAKHRIIHDRLDAAAEGKDNYLISEDGKRSLE